MIAHLSDEDKQELKRLIRDEISSEVSCMCHGCCDSECYGSYGDRQLDGLEDAAVQIMKLLTDKLIIS